ncbi:MFS_1_like domain-containing protein [Caerostris extrusa]|uniref:MFS_1_like domain-containing protein n=1 Tax=Caerostris extrusa TaxID=172846 RepID=A0AAV4TCN6_CAEEX|nr:MFS_1_like domain-containing protein [Caerostris extrusa]
MNGEEGKDQSWTITIYNKYEIHINKTFIPVKMSLFFWFAGAMTTSTFLPVILKHQGLTVAHLSVFIAFAVFIQFLSSLVSGVIADKIGRAKPILFTYYTAILVIIFSFYVATEK